MNFEYEELTLMMLYNPGTRLGLIQELRLMQCYLAPDEARPAGHRWYTCRMKPPCGNCPNGSLKS